MTPYTPPPGFEPVVSHVDGIELYAPRSESGARPDVVRFPCPSCGAARVFDAATDSLSCAHCGTRESAADPAVGRLAGEFEFRAEAFSRVAEPGRKELLCSTCGNRTSLAPGSLTHICPFCSSSVVVQSEPAEDLMRPRFLVPFKIPADQCRSIAERWLGRRWLVPPSAVRAVTEARLSGVYLPFWTFDATVYASWRARVASKKASGGRGAWRSGSAREAVDDHLVPGTAALHPALLSRVSKFPIAELVPYDARCLAGFHAKAFDVSLTEAWRRSRMALREKMHQKCWASFGEARVRDLALTIDFKDERFRYILLPMYVAAYRHRGKTGQILINGQTGAVAGQLVMDWGRVARTAGFSLLPGFAAGAAALVLSRAGLAGPGTIAWLAGVLLFLIGLVISVAVVITAFELEKGTLDDGKGKPVRTVRSGS